MLAVPRANAEKALEVVVAYQERNLPDEGDDHLSDSELNEGELACPACGHVSAEDVEECPDCGIRLA